MKITIDCGSSKCAFAINNEPCSFFTPGFNPQITAINVFNDFIEQQIELKSYLQSANEIAFFGAGCSSSDINDMVKSYLLSLNPNARITVGHDLDLCVDKLADSPCFVCILGTGSNAAYFDGLLLHPIIPSLGYLLGDEGSGVYIGKKLIRDFYYQKLPPDLFAYFQQHLPSDPQIILEKVYKQPMANRFIASFTAHLAPFIHIPYVQNLIEQSLNEFIHCFLLRHPQIKELPVHFSGSIAFHFKPILEKIMLQNGLILGKVVKQPL
jgi:N-acetylglucosamine kinase-like BadF-type ATPase